MPQPVPFSLEPSPHRGDHNEALASVAGGRVGLEGVLDELGRTGRTARRAGPLVTSGGAVKAAWAWELRDDLSRRWWPQGITTSADAGAVGGPGPLLEEYAGRRVVLTSAYSKVVDGVGHGARITVVDVTDRERVRYEHVLLVRAVSDPEEGVRLEPVQSHAGGLVWHGDHLHVAATRKGIDTFRLSDVVPVGTGGGLAAHGHRWVLPVHVTHTARTEEGGRAFRYSWLSSSREGDRVTLLAGEYAPPSDPASTRLAAFAVDPATGLPAVDDGGHARPELLGQVVAQAQGAVRTGDRLYVGTSNGRFRRGAVWVGTAGDGVRPASFVRRSGTLPVGPEDLAHWPSRDELWTVTEYPGRRRLVVLDRGRIG